VLLGRRHDSKNLSVSLQLARHSGALVSVVVAALIRGGLAHEHVTKLFKIDFVIARRIETVKDQFLVLWWR
jgi:hypothetical protein